MLVRNMQKPVKLGVYEYKGNGWYGEVYEEKNHTWSWALAVDRGRTLECEGGMGLESFVAAYSLLKVAVVDAGCRM